MSADRDKLQNSLFGIICRICKKTRINMLGDTICTLYNHSMVVCIDEIVVKHFTKDGMHQVSATMGKDVGRRSFTSERSIKVIEGVG